MSGANPQTSSEVANFIDAANELLKTDVRVNDGGKQNRSIYTPAWLPDSFLRSRKKNLYLNMLDACAVLKIGEHLEFYEEPKGGKSFMDKIKGAMKSALGSAVTAVTNQVGAMANTAQGIASALGLTDDKKDEGNEFLAVLPDVTTLPRLKVYGFNFSPPISQTLEIIKQAWEIMRNITNSTDGFDAFYEKLKKALEKALDEFRSQKNKGGSLKPAEFVVDQHGIAEAFILNSSPGVYKIETAIPYISNDRPMLSIEGSDDNWCGGLTDSMSANSKINELLAGSTGINLGMSSQLNWVAKNIERCTPVKTTFSLYNDTLTHLAMNFKFILGFFQTAMPTTGGMLLRSPFLYDIVLPTGLKYYSCICEFEIKCRGKLRKLSEEAAKLVGDSIGDSGYVACATGTLGTRFSDMSKAGKTELYFPDAYDVTVTFKSLLPDTWNFIAGWLIDSNNAAAPKLGDDKGTVIVNMISAFSQEFTKQKTPTDKSDV